MPKAYVKDKIESLTLQTKQTQNKMAIPVRGQPTLPHMQCTEVLSRQEK